MHRVPFQTVSSSFFQSSPTPRHWHQFICPPLNQNYISLPFTLHATFYDSLSTSFTFQQIHYYLQWTEPASSLRPHILSFHSCQNCIFCPNATAPKQEIKQSPDTPPCKSWPGPLAAPILSAHCRGWTHPVNRLFIAEPSLQCPAGQSHSPSKPLHTLTAL